MLDMMENHSAKICIGLLILTGVGGGILLLGGSTLAAATVYVSASNITILTTATGVGALAAGGSCLQKEKRRRENREQLQNQAENHSRYNLRSNSLNGLRAVRLTEQSRNTQRSSIVAQNDGSLRVSVEDLKISQVSLEEENKAIKAELSAVKMDMRRMQGLFETISDGLDLKEIHDEKQKYMSDQYGGLGTRDEESKKPLLSGRNMFTGQSRAGFQISANDANHGVVHRRRPCMSTND